MSIRYWLLTIAVAVATCLLLLDETNIWVAGFGSFWAASLAALFGLASDQRRSGDTN